MFRAYYTSLIYHGRIVLYVPLTAASQYGQRLHQLYEMDGVRHVS